MFGMFGGLGMGGGGSFEAHYRAMPVAFIDKQSAEYGDKVILPPSALDRLASLHIEYPMLFKVEGLTSGRFTHCGVLEFIAEEGVVYMPHWMMQNMLLQVGDMVKLRNVSLPKGQYVKLQPVTSDFLDISNPKAVLERTLRSYTCLTVGDCFVVNYNNKNYEIEVKECRPGTAISVVETDCQVDFEAPKDYKEPERVVPASKAPAAAVGAASGSSSQAAGAAGQADDKKAAGSNGSGGAEDAAGPSPGTQTFLAFAGTARRLDGRAITSTATPVPVTFARPGAVVGGASQPAASPSGSQAGAAASGAGGKAGTFVSTGNRLLDKLAREQAQKSGGAAPAPAAAPAPVAEPQAKAAAGDGAAAGSKEGEEGSSFQAFAGKSYKLK